MCLDMFLNNASLPYQHLVDSQAESYKKSKLLDDYRQNIVNLENTIKTKDEYIAYLVACHENTIKTKDEELAYLVACLEHIERNITDHENTIKTKDRHLEQLLNTIKTKDEQLEQLRKLKYDLKNRGLRPVPY